VNKAAASAAQLAKSILLHAYSCTTGSFQLREHKQKLHNYRLFNKLTLRASAENFPGGSQQKKYRKLAKNTEK